MKRPTLSIVLLLFSCVSAFAGPQNDRYNVTMIGGTTKGGVDRSLELILSPDLITALQKTCGDGAVVFHCSSVIAKFQPSAITEVAAGLASNFIGVAWTEGGQKSMLIIEPRQKENPAIVGFLEHVTGRKAIIADNQRTDGPRVLLNSQSFGTQLNAVRNQSMEMAKDFAEVCSAVQITINVQKADFTLQLNHIESSGLLYRDNQVQVYDKDGDLISGMEGGSIMHGVKDACALIITEWAARPASATLPK
jgi:hypothetical protein